MSQKETINAPQRATNATKGNETATQSWFIERYTEGVPQEQPNKEDTDNETHIAKLDHLQKEDFTLSIIQTEIDGKDYTKQYLYNDGFLAFYERNGKMHFTNCWQKTGRQTYGEIEILKQHEQGGASYLWHYANTDNDKTGTAIILLRLTTRPVAVAFELSILKESAELQAFKGYVNDSIKWKPF